MSVITCSSDPSDLNAEHVCCTSDTCNHLDVSNAVASVIASMPRSCYVEHMDCLSLRQDLAGLRRVWDATQNPDTASDGMRAKGYIACAMMAMLKEPVTEVLSKALTLNLAKLKRLEPSFEASRTSIRTLFTSKAKLLESRIIEEATEISKRLTATCDMSRAANGSEGKACQEREA